MYLEKLRSGGEKHGEGGLDLSGVSCVLWLISMKPFYTINNSDAVLTMQNEMTMQNLGSKAKPVECIIWLLGGYNGFLHHV